MHKCAAHSTDITQDCQLEPTPFTQRNEHPKAPSRQTKCP